MKLNCYSSGDGFIRRKSEKHLADNSWQPVFINCFWCLARKITRINDYTLRIAGDRKDTAGKYEIVVDRGLVHEDGSVPGYAFHAFFWLDKRRHEVKSESILMVIRFFLSHEEELTKQFKENERNERLRPSCLGSLQRVAATV